MKATIGKRFSFEAAHVIPFHKNPDGTRGKCSYEHGHSYHGMAYMRGEVDSNGWVKDFYLIGQDLQSVVGRFDHSKLNDIVPFSENYLPTTEHVALTILMRLLKLDPRYCTVVIEETDSSLVSVDVEDL